MEGILGCLGCVFWFVAGIAAIGFIVKFAMIVFQWVFA